MPSLPRLPSHRANIPLLLPVHAIPSMHRNHCPIPYDFCPWANNWKCLILLFKLLFFALLWKAPAPLLLSELEGTRMMGIWGVCAQLPYLLSLDRPLPTLLIPVVSCSVTLTKWEQNNSLGKNFSCLKPLSWHHRINGIFFPINL